MATHSTTASIKNIRKQRQLELELVELDRQWHVELKIIARERLALVKELCRINEDMQAVDHFHDTMHGKTLRRFADRAHGRMLKDKELKETHKFNFEPDPVEKMNLQLPLIKEEGAGEEIEAGGDIAKVLTAKDLYKQRVHLQKSNYDQCTADRRSRRRPFWDKAIIDSNKPKTKDRNGFFRAQRGGGLFGQAVLFPLSSSSTDMDDDRPPVRSRGLSKSPSLPALNRLRRSDSNFRANAIHPSLSKRHSASMDYLPVLKSSKGQSGLSKAHKVASLSSVALPTIVES